jgi:hypothetical protein
MLSRETNCVIIDIAIVYGKYSLDSMIGTAIALE